MLRGRAFAVASATSIAIALIVGGCSSGKAGYGNATEGVFLAGCSPQHDPTRDDVCRCAYDEVTKQIPYSDYESINSDLQADPKRKLPDNVMQIVGDCAARIDFGARVPSGGSSSSSSTSSSSSSRSSGSSSGRSSSSSSASSSSSSR